MRSVLFAVGLTVTRGTFDEIFAENIAQRCPPSYPLKIEGRSVRTFIGDNGKLQAVTTDNELQRRFLIHTWGKDSNPLEIEIFMTMRAFYDKFADPDGMSSQFGRAINDVQVPLSCAMRMLVIEVKDSPDFPKYKEVIDGQCPPAVFGENVIDFPSETVLEFYEAVALDEELGQVAGHVVPSDKPASYCANRYLRVATDGRRLSEIPEAEFTISFAASLGSKIVSAYKVFHERGILKNRQEVEDVFVVESDEGRIEAVRLLGYDHVTKFDGHKTEAIKADLLSGLSVVMGKIPGVSKTLNILPFDPETIYTDFIYVLDRAASTGVVVKPLTSPLADGAIELVNQFKAKVSDWTEKIVKAANSAGESECPPQGLKVGSRTCGKPRNNEFSCGGTDHYIFDLVRNDGSLAERAQAMASAKAFTDVYGGVSGVDSSIVKLPKSVPSSCNDRLLVRQKHSEGEFLKAFKVPLVGPQAKKGAIKKRTAVIQQLHSIAASVIEALKTIHSYGLVHGAVSAGTIVVNKETGALIFSETIHLFVDTKGRFDFDVGHSRLSDLISLADAFLSRYVDDANGSDLFHEFKTALETLYASEDDPNYDEWIEKFRSKQ